jgi:hypothetical protein
MVMLALFRQFAARTESSISFTLMFRSFFSRVFSWFTPIAKNIINWRITSQKAQWNAEYTSAKMPRMNRKVYTSFTSASGGESRGMKLLGQTNTTISK